MSCEESQAALSLSPERGDQSSGSQGSKIRDSAAPLRDPIHTGPQLTNPRATRRAAVACRTCFPTSLMKEDPKPLEPPASDCRSTGHKQRSCRRPPAETSTPPPASAAFSRGRRVFAVCPSLSHHPHASRPRQPLPAQQSAAPPLQEQATPCPRRSLHLTPSPAPQSRSRRPEDVLGHGRPCQDTGGGPPSSPGAPSLHRRASTRLLLRASPSGNAVFLSPGSSSLLSLRRAHCPRASSGTGSFHGYTGLSPGPAASSRNPSKLPAVLLSEKLLQV